MAKLINEFAVENGTVAVRRFALLAKDYPGASAVWEDGAIVGYKAWSSTVHVGDYDDWQVADAVRAWCAEQGINADSLPWYAEAA